MSFNYPLVTKEFIIGKVHFRKRDENSNSLELTRTGKVAVSDILFNINKEESWKFEVKHCLLIAGPMGSCFPDKNTEPFIECFHGKGYKLASTTLEIILNTYSDIEISECIRYMEGYKTSNFPPTFWENYIKVKQKKPISLEVLCFIKNLENKC